MNAYLTLAAGFLAAHWLLAIEILAAAFGVAGTLFLAMKTKRAGWGFVAYLVSNSASLVFFWIQQHWALFGQQLAFLASSLVGIWVWLLRPHARLFRSVYRTTRPYRDRLQAARLAFRCVRNAALSRSALQRTHHPRAFPSTLTTQKDRS